MFDSPIRKLGLVQNIYVILVYVNILVVTMNTKVRRNQTMNFDKSKAFV